MICKHFFTIPEETDIWIDEDDRLPEEVKKSADWKNYIKIKSGGNIKWNLFH